MTLDYADGLLRGAAAALLLLIAANFARGWRAGLTMRLGVALALGGASYLTLPIMVGPQHHSGPGVVFHILSLSAPAFFWLFTSSWFDDEFELRPWHGLVLLAATCVGLMSNYLLPALGIRMLPVFSLWRIVSLVLVAAGLRAVLAGREADLVEGRRRLRLVLAVAIGLAIAWLVAAEMVLTGWPPPAGWRLANSASLLALAGGLAFVLLGFADPALFAAAAPRAAAPVADDSALLARLDALMTAELLWRQEGLSITALAARLGVPEYRLRRAINTGLGARNFNAYLNGWRVREAAAALGDPTQAEVSVLTIALDAGFGSLAPFNRAFRTEFGCTPSEYRAGKR